MISIEAFVRVTLPAMERSKARQIRAKWIFGALLLGAPATTSAAPPLGRAGAAQGVELPTVGAVAFTYQRAPAVAGCSQRAEDDVRDLIEGVVHAAPFVPPGEPARFSIEVQVTRPRAGLVRATFSLFDAARTPKGVSTVEDATCDGAHLKLAASIALLLSPRPAPAPPACPACPPPTCDGPCREAAREEAAARVRRELREVELPRLREEARRELQQGQGRGPTPFSSLRAVVAAGPVLGLNLAEEPARGFWLSGEARAERWSVLLEMRATLPARAFTLQDGRSTLDLSSVSGIVAPCVRWWWLGACALVEAGGFLVAATRPRASSTQGGSQGYVASALLGLGLRVRLDAPLVAGFEARLFADAVGHPVGLSLDGDDPTGPGGAASPAAYSFDAPRAFSAFVGIGVGRSFE